MTKKIALVTGASRGIGKAVSISLAKQGYFVVLVARNEMKLKNVYDEIRKQNGSAIVCPVDVSDPNQVKSCINEMITQFGRIDLLFNNAGILKSGTTDISDDDINNLIQTNLNGAIYVAKYVAEQMKRQREGYIINLSSLGGKVAASFAGIYAASKFGLSGFSEALFKEMSLYGVKVTNLCPSMIATEMTEGRTFPQDEMIETADICKTIDYLLSLSKNAIPQEIAIHCLPFVEKTTTTANEIYGFKGQ